MTSPLPPDPYAALGVPKSADLQTIKSTYKKLVLKCHPDKFPDEAIKAQKQEEFQKIQQAYELVGDDDARAHYDAQLRLAEMRREGMERQRTSGEGPRVEVRTGYKVRTAEPTSFSRSSPETPKQSRSFEDDRYVDDQRSSSRKHEGYDSFRRSPRTEREDRTRSERKKTREREEKRDRTNKYAHVEDDDERSRYEAGFRRRSEEEREQRALEEIKRKVDEVRKAEEHKRREREREAEDKARKSRREPDYDNYEKKFDDARDYIQRSKAPSDEPRPSATRAHTSAAPQQYYEVRRSRAGKSERRSSRERERRHPEIVEPSATEWKPPPLEKAHTAPIKVTRVSPHRRGSHDFDDRSPPRLQRSESDPLARRKEAAPSQPSRLRESIPADSGYSIPAMEAQYSSAAKSGTTKTYHRYTAVADDYPANHRTVLREPRYRGHTPSPPRERVIPMAPKLSPNVTTTSGGVRYTTVPRPPIPHATTSTVVEDYERGRDRSARPVYSDSRDSYRRVEKPTMERGASYKVDDVTYAKRYVKDDVHFSRGYEQGYEAAKRQFEREIEADRSKMGRPTAVY